MNPSETEHVRNSYNNFIEALTLKSVNLKSAGLIEEILYLYWLIFRKTNMKEMYLCYCIFIVTLFHYVLMMACNLYERMNNEHQI